MPIKRNGLQKIRNTTRNGVIMRRYIKKNLLTLIHSIGEAHKIIKEQLKKQNNNMVLQLLEDCQESAIQIGTTLEQLEECDTNAVLLLEDYCELAYQLSMSIGKEDHKLIKFMQQKVNQVSNYIYVLKEELEIVFLPYKASMWDSLESIWKAAHEDPCCQTYVIPIPYYDKNPDGSFGTMHYDGSEFPDDVTIVDWRSYSLAERYPDVIYIHNPYDDNNKVTSVHPDFYSERLRNYTKRLVYIPYFICERDVPSHFCVCPGTIYANTVVVQSDLVRETYIREYEKFEEINHIKGEFGNAEEKFLALGSPKIDKIRSIEQENFVIPQSWKNLIEGKNHRRKKVILYNTTIGSLLVEKEKLIKKIESVLQIFQSNQEDVVLLWRPHPLFETTLKSMVPQLLSHYLNLIECYQREGWGIFDDSEDLQRAIAVSDAYFGDRGSVEVLYKETGKPILIQNIELVL